MNRQMQNTMKKYTVVKVETKQQMNDFLKLPVRLYEGCPYYVPEMESDVRDTFNPKKNPASAFFKIQLFVAYNENGNAVGRIAGIINKKANDIWSTKNVRFGLIEFIDDPDLAQQLISAVEEYGRAEGMENIEGPLGITDFDKEGMLVSDFDQTASMTTIYNPPYYPEYLQQMGFQKACEWLQVRIEIPEELPKRFARSANVVREMYDVRVRTYTKKEVFSLGVDQKIFNLFNEAYKPLYGYSEFDTKQATFFLKRYVPLLDMDLIPFVVDKDDNLIAIAIVVGALTEALQKSKGRLLPFGWYHLLKSLKFKHEEKAELMLIAVDPKYHGMGLNALIIEHILTALKNKGYKWAEASPMLETNMKVLTQWRGLNAKEYKHRRCFIKKI